MYFAVLILSFLFFLRSGGGVLAITDPVSTPNNKIGIHILFPDELHQAAEIVNKKNESAWGYVTIPIQATDRNREKWQNFFDKCVEKQIIPIVRIATVPSGSNWEKPNGYDLIDFANFLYELEWPVQNRYVVIFNEVNRPDEYGGKADPAQYAHILSNAIDIFKARSDDFFILPAGLDNAASNQFGSIFWKDYLFKMNLAVPGIFERIDGWNSHAYPNPDFSSRPDKSGYNKIDSYKYDLQYLKRFTNKNLPVFITETGWSTKYLSEMQISLYYDYAFQKVWIDENIVAITPFLLNAQDGPFTVFSFLGKDNSPKEFVRAYSRYSQIGEPIVQTATPLASVTENNEPDRSGDVLGSEVDYQNLIYKIYTHFSNIIELVK